MVRRLFILAAFSLFFEAQESTAFPDADGVVAGAHPAALETDPRAMIALELRGLSFGQLFGAARSASNEHLAGTPLYDSMLATLDADLGELNARPSVGEYPQPNRPFRPSWLRDARARFDLVAAVHRLDRRFVAGEPCGEARLVYRLVLQPSERPPTALPMTVNVIFPQPDDGDGCRARARAWQDLPRSGAARIEAIAAIYRSLPPFTKVETNLQNMHGASFRPDQDDHAEYLLRSFERRGDVLVARPLLDTPRTDLDEASRAELATWIREHFDEIDRGAYEIPERLLASRAVSVAPRGLARIRNRPFEQLFGGGAMFADLPYGRTRLVKSPRGLLRRLDQGTCVGCHETRAMAGFHLLGEHRNPEARLNAIAVPRSTHLSIELRWRAEMIAAVGAGRAYDEPRPFAERRSAGAGGPGAHCALDADPTFVGWTCAPGLRCRNHYGDEVGICVPADGSHEGDACEDVTVFPDDGPDGDRVIAAPREECVIGNLKGHECSPLTFGFPGGMCSAPCTTLGKRSPADPFVCTDLPATGYEVDCFKILAPIEECLATHSLRRRVRWCDAQHACRDDYVCVRVPGLPPHEGACAPPYFAFQTRVDGPLLDR